MRNILLSIGLLASVGAWAGSASVENGTRAVDPEAQALVRELVSRQPESMQVRCRLKMRGPDGPWSEVLVRYTIIPDGEGWKGIYETENGPQAEQLIVMHRGLLPNQYVYRKGEAHLQSAQPVVLSGAEAAIPFAGSDFWLSDLGMDFLHWPEQRLDRDAKITMRMGRPCKVLESVNPHSTGYGRVLSWIDSEFGGLIYAEAYDRQGQRLKVFSLKGFKKINGTVHVKEMEIRNDQADSRTRLEFLFEE